MKKDLFIEHLKKHGVIIISSSDPEFDERMLNDFRRLKDFIKYIDFSCQITPKGGCKEESGCCFDCFEKAGHFRCIIDTDISMYARVFNVKTGFWGRKGCVLSYKMRSSTCLTHHCNGAEKGMENFGFGIIILRNKLHDLRNKI